MKNLRELEQTVQRAELYNVDPPTTPGHLPHSGWSAQPRELQTGLEYEA